MQRSILLPTALALGLFVLILGVAQPTTAEQPPISPDPSALDVPLTVRETAGVGTDGYLASAVIPLPQGQYTTTDTLGIAGAPSQVEVLERWPDDSLRHVQVHFQPTVAADGDVVYHFADSGRTDPADPVTVVEGSDAVTVTTGPLRFTVRKTAFNVLDEVWFDQNDDGVFEAGERVIASHSQNGGVFEPRAGAGTTQYDTARADLTIDVEESGPMRAVIRAEALAQFITTTNHTHGFAARIYAYAGKSYVKVDYQLQNSAKVVRSWPLYFEAMNLDFQLDLGANPTVKFGLGDDTMFIVADNASTAHLAQEMHHTFKIYTPTQVYDSGRLPDNEGPDGFIDVTDGSRGVTGMIRNFWQTWPNGLAVDSANKLSLQLFPDWSARWHYGEVSPTGLYWLDDMQHVYKETMLYFHGAGVVDGDLIDLARTFQYAPVAVVPVDWHRQAQATLDMGGVLPQDTYLPAPSDQRQPILSWSRYSETHVYYGLGWPIFGDPEPGYRARPCTTGGWPYFYADFFVTTAPADYFLTEIYGLGELNVRPEWIAQYEHDLDWPTLELSANPYCGNSWRIFEGHGASAFIEPPLPGTGTGDGRDGDGPVYRPRDDQHGWFYHVPHAYFMTGNPWIRDWYQFVAQFRRTRLEHLDPWPDHTSRATGHSLNHVVQAYRVTGDETILTRFRDHIRTHLRPDQDPYYGDQLESVESYGGGFQTGYLARTIVDYLEEVRAQEDWQAYAEGFNYLSGLMEWNLNYGNFPYYFNAREGGEGSSSGTGLTMVDPQAWYYWHTGKQTYLDHLEAYMGGGINGGSGPYGNFSTWQGQYEGRYYLFVKGATRSDTTPPPAITDLGATWVNSTTVFLEWTAPSDATRYHVVYSDKPIVEPNSLDPNVTNWWAAYAIGPSLTPTPGATQTLIFTPAFAGPCYVAIFTFDEADNMSAISNVPQALPGDWESIYLPLVMRTE